MMAFSPTYPIDVKGIMALLPHRPPFLMVERVIDGEQGVGYTVESTISVNDPWIVGHFPDEPVFPGVLQIETAAQAAGVGFCLEEGGRAMVGYLTTVERFRFRRKVIPGDVLTTRVMLQNSRRGFHRWQAELSVAGQVVSGGVVAAWVERPDEEQPGSEAETT